MLISSMKYLTASSLATGVRMHYGQADPLTLDYNQIVSEHEASIMEFRHVQLDFHRGMKLVMLDWGWVIETTQETAGKDIIKETLVSHDSRNAVITARQLNSSPTTVMGWKCMRDDDYPVGSIVRLLRKETQCAYELMGHPPF
jgi:hypothetical protein